MVFDDTYFSDRELGPKPRTNEEITEAVWGGIISLIESRLADGSFAQAFPLECPDGAGIYSCNQNSFTDALAAEIPGISFPAHSSKMPPTLAILDLTEFCHRHVAKAIQTGYHDFFKHHHLKFEKEEGQDQFRVDINRIFTRNGLAYKLEDNGQIVRLAPDVLRQTLSPTIFRTGDTDLDNLLESARTKFFSPDPLTRKESLEKLWDAWERIKTIEPGKDKKAQVTALLDRVATESNLKERLEKEAIELTSIGNFFQIRHSETQQTPLQLNEYVDYLFHRLFSMIWLILKTTSRGS